MSTKALIDGERTELERLRAEVAALRKARSHEHDIALREAAEIAAEDAYFLPRPVADSAHARRAFSEGFSRGWKAAIDAAMSEQAMQVLDDPQAHGFSLPPGHGEHEPLI